MTGINCVVHNEPCLMTGITYFRNLRLYLMTGIRCVDHYEPCLMTGTTYFRNFRLYLMTGINCVVTQFIPVIRYYRKFLTEVMLS